MKLFLGYYKDKNRVYSNTDTKYINVSCETTNIVNYPDEIKLSIKYYASEHKKQALTLFNYAKP